jgi:hypothetical protein
VLCFGTPLVLGRPNRSLKLLGAASVRTDGTRHSSTGSCVQPRAASVLAGHDCRMQRLCVCVFSCCCQSQRVRRPGQQSRMLLFMVYSVSVTMLLWGDSQPYRLWFSLGDLVDFCSLWNFAIDPRIVCGLAAIVVLREGRGPKHTCRQGEALKKCYSRRMGMGQCGM